MWQVNGKLMCEMPFEKGKINGKAVLYKADGVEELLFKDDYPILLDK
jgi:antitoxin component YwqK of YwqJK toxin-antitoxin module